MKMISKTVPFGFSSAAIGISMLFASSPQAAPVTQCGPSICYAYDNAQSGVASFGNPLLVGDSLVFLVPNFRAESVGGAGLDQAIDSFVFDSVYSVSGDAIQYIGITEFGDYEVTNGDRVSAQLDIDVMDNGSLESGTVTELFSYSGGTSGLTTWDLNGYYNPDMNFSGSANNLKVTITDILEAETNAAGEVAWIQKKVQLAATTVVPVPAAIWLFVSALGLLGGRAIRR